MGTRCTLPHVFGRSDAREIPKVVIEVGLIEIPSGERNITPVHIGSGVNPC